MHPLREGVPELVIGPELVMGGAPGESGSGWVVGTVAIATGATM